MGCVVLCRAVLKWFVRVGSHCELCFAALCGFMLRFVVGRVALCCVALRRVSFRCVASLFVELRCVALYCLELC